MDGEAVVDGTLLGFVDVIGIVIVEGVSDGCLLGATVSVGHDVGMCVGTVDIVGDDVCACTI